MLFTTANLVQCLRAEAVGGGEGSDVSDACSANLSYIELGA